MTDTQGAFLTRLREIFRVEAAEHVEAMSAGLVALERTSEAERPDLVERIFRDAHSLKGAARAANITAVESICQELESLFAAMKREELAASPAVLDVLHPAIDLVGTLCASPGAPESPEDVERCKQVLSNLGHVGSGPESADRVSRTPRAEAPPHADAPAPPPDSLRVSAGKLGDVLTQAEELASAKLSALGRAGELRDLAADLAAWNQRRVGEAGRRRRGQGGAEAVTELLESEMLHSRTIESALRRLAGAAQQDALTLAGMTDGLLEDTKKLLLLPCSYLLNAMPKLLRDLAHEQGRDADLVVSGDDTQVDRRVLDELRTPLWHLLRNCVDHGLERSEVRSSLGKPPRGTVMITATAVAGQRVEFTVSDDGAGIDTAKVRKAAVRSGLISADEAVAMSDADAVALIFQSGLTTSPIITALSGRGLGLAIVREKVEMLGGSIRISSTPGAGTVCHIEVPSTLATFRGVVVETAGRRLIVPSASVEKVARIAPTEMTSVENRPTMTVGGEAVALVRLRDVLELAGPEQRTDGTKRPVLVVRAGDRKVAFVVDGVQGEQEVMFKRLGPQLPRVRNIAGAALAGSGTVIPILDAAELLDSATAAGASRGVGTGETEAEADTRCRRLLVAEDSITARTLVKSTLEGAGYEVATAVDGLDALTTLKTEAFDLLVSDVDMPRMNGFELTAKIRADKKLGELPVVLVTALGSQKDREYGIECGANAYIAKSDFDQGDLLEIIRRLL